jgi:HK97 family phage major capsid protein
MVKKTLKELLDQRKTHRLEAETIVKKAADEKRSMTVEEEGLCDQLIDKAEALNGEIDALQKGETRSERLKKLNEPIIAPPRGPEVPSEDRSDPVENPDPLKYSILRAVRCICDKKAVDGYEGEISQEIALRSNKSPQGFFIPFNLRTRPLNGREQRAFDTTAGAGAIPTIIGPTMIDALRNRMVMARLGMQILSGLVGTFELPKLTGTSTAYWVTEGNSPTASAATVGQVPFVAKTMGALTDVTRRLMNQSAIDAEMIARNDLLKVIAIELDRAALNGSNSGGQPKGIMQNSSITTVTVDGAATDGDVVAWTDIVRMESTVAAANADANTMAYLTSAVGRGKLKVTPKLGSTFPTFCWNEDGTMNGYRAEVSNQVPSNLTKGAGTTLTALLFGDFSQAVMAFWTGIDLMVDPYTLSSSGGIRLVGLVDCDFNVRYAQAFAKILTMVR